MADNALLVNVGTALTMASDDIASVHYPRVKISVGADGAAADWAGTIGTLSVLAKGTISAGTIDAGTVLTYGQRHADAFATVVSTGTNTLGTIRAGVSGSAIYVNWLIISAGSATNVEIGNGGTDLPLVGTLYFNANGGAIAAPLNPPISTSAGSSLVYKQSASGPLSITAGG